MMKKRDLSTPLAKTFNDGPGKGKKKKMSKNPNKRIQEYLADPNVKVAGYRKEVQPDGKIALVGKGTAKEREGNYAGSIFKTKAEADARIAKELAKKKGK